uniref:MATH domain-containing protein n=1 Tax=Parastrongyloides trichosuri TaxID=131310 RepID=A0A0N4ZTH9_PARTI
MKDENIVFINGERYIKDLNLIGAPSTIGRVRLFLVPLKASTSTSIIDICHLKLRWTDSEFWNDGFDDSNRKYHIICEVYYNINNSFKKIKFLDFYVNNEFTGYDERFQPDNNHAFAVICGVQAINSKGLPGKWKTSRMMHINKASV